VTDTFYALLAISMVLVVVSVLVPVAERFRLLPGFFQDKTVSENVIGGHFNSIFDHRMPTSLGYSCETSLRIGNLNFLEV
jgi:hypothetical protein